MFLSRCQCNKSLFEKDYWYENKNGVKSKWIGQAKHWQIQTIPGNTVSSSSEKLDTITEYLELHF